MPAVTVPLQIFEARYRVLFSTLLAGLPKIDEGLVQEDSEYKGSRLFGMCLSDKGQMVSLGSLLYIKQHEVLDDGRILIVTEGRQRFRVTQVVQERPVLMCEVEMLPHDDDTSAETVALADEVRQLFRDIVELGTKMKKGASAEFAIPEDLDKLSPCLLPYWVINFFPEYKVMQQELLEIETARERLLKLKALLDDSVRYMSAASALQSAFTSEGGSDSETDAAGPDKAK